MADEPNNTYGLVVLDCPTLATLSSSHNVQGTQPTFLYAAQFSSAADGGRYIAAGGSGANETKVSVRPGLRSMARKRFQSFKSNCYA